MNIGENIRRNRRNLDITQEQLAEKLSVSVQYVSRWETGTTYPDMEMMPALAGIFSATVDSLFGCTYEEKRQYCEELYHQQEQAASSNDIPAVLAALRKIRRNLQKYQDYWYWGIYNLLWCRRLDRNPDIMTELRLLTDEIFR